MIEPEHGMDEDGKLPLHDEAKARSKWRGGETILDKGGKNIGLPASEVDDAAADGERPKGAGAARPGRAPGNIPPPD